MKHISDLLQGLPCDYTCLCGSVDQTVSDLVYDSRKVEAGCAFVCLTGANFDAHDYIPQAVEKGAKAIFVEKEVPPYKGVTVIRVENTRRALAFLSAAYFDYPAKKLTLIGITGTKGKTTTAWMIKALLEKAGHKTGIIGTIGAFYGDIKIETKNSTPESCELHRLFSQMLLAGCTHVVMEVSSQAFMTYRVAGIRFQYGIFTNLSPDHIGEGEHKDFAEYLYYKSQIFKSSEICIANADDSHFLEVSEGSACRRIYTYGCSKDADLRAEQIFCLREPGFIGVDCRTAGIYNMEVKIGCMGKFNAYNAMAAMLTAYLLSMHTDVERKNAAKAARVRRASREEKTFPARLHTDAERKCAEEPPASGAAIFPASAIQEVMYTIKVRGRMEPVHISDHVQLLIDYAHNAVSAESLLTAILEYKPKRLICVFGAGGNRSKLRRYDMGEIAGKYADLSILTADNPRYEEVEDIIADIKIGMEKSRGHYIEIPDRREAIRYSIEHAADGDIIALFGKGHEDYQEIKGVRYPFDDREVVEEIVESRKGRMI